MIVTKTQNVVICPWCERETGSVDHLTLGDYPVKWSCNSCKHVYVLTNTTDDIKTIQVAKGEYRYYSIAVYITHGDMCVVMKHDSSVIKIGADIEWAEEWKYINGYVNKHACPSSIFGFGIEGVIRISDGEDDPHGILTVHAIEPWNSDMDEDDYKWKIPAVKYPGIADEQITRKTQLSGLFGQSFARGVQSFLSTPVIFTCLSTIKSEPDLIIGPMIKEEWGSLLGLNVAVINSDYISDNCDYYIIGCSDMMSIIIRLVTSNDQEVAIERQSMFYNIGILNGPDCDIKSGDTIITCNPKTGELRKRKVVLRPNY